MTVSDITSLCEACCDIGLSSKHPLPLHKILFTLYRRGYLQTIIVEDEPENPQFLGELSLDQDAAPELIRYHFFRTALEHISADTYGGYCDVRPADASIAGAIISFRTIGSGLPDAYSFVPCRMVKELSVPLQSGEKLPVYVEGFPYLQKNLRETMCAQAALLGTVQYWQEKIPNVFNGINSARDINRLAGLTQEQELEPAGRGLSPEEIDAFFRNAKSHSLSVNYNAFTLEKVKEMGVLTDVYGFIESGYPVIAAVKTFGGMHALTFVGHTFDKNSWAAMANLGYFGRLSQYYHSNITWIENLIIQDDNFGPYYFFPMGKLESIIAYMIVALPTGRLEVLPHEATDVAVHQTIYNDEFISFLSSFLKSNPPECDKNIFWFDEFKKHLKVTCGDGLVLRPILRTGAEVIDSYSGHEFFESVNQFLSGEKNRKFWAVELSWPDIYCFSQCMSGLALVDAEDRNAEMPLAMLHLPGMWFGFDDKNIYNAVAQQEDPPRPHFKTAKLVHEGADNI